MPSRLWPTTSTAGFARAGRTAGRRRRTTWLQATTTAAPSTGSAFSAWACPSAGAPGLLAGYASLQPLDLVGIEFDYGTQPCATPVGPDQITVWPGMLSAKLQVFGGRRSRPSQVGFEVAADWAEQAGWGGHGAFLLRLRPDPHFNVDFNLGARSLLQQRGGYGHVREEPRGEARLCPETSASGSSGRCPTTLWAASA